MFKQHFALDDALQKLDDNMALLESCDLAISLQVSLIARSSKMIDQSDFRQHCYTNLWELKQQREQVAKKIQENIEEIMNNGKK